MIALKNLHLYSVPRNTRNAFLRCASSPFFSTGGWYLAGGTALALQVGHRQSVDLDFFTPEKEFDEKTLEAQLSQEGDWKTTSLDYATLYGEFFGVKMSLIAYPSFQPADPFVTAGMVRLMTPRDIAAMKIVAISQRGKKRDFVDLYWLCLNIQPLSESIARAARQYSVRQNEALVLKSLVYFADAEDDPAPVTFFDADWKTVKAYFRREVPEIAKRLMGLE